MLIDWFTVGAQALNFLVLVWLMRRYLYKPILHAIDAREALIAKKLAQANAAGADLKTERAAFDSRSAEFDQQRAALLAKATDEAGAERQRLLDEARLAADALSARRQEALVAEAQHLNEAIGRRTQQEVFAIARRALGDLASASLEERLVDVFTRRLRELDSGAKEALATALRASSEPALVRSAFELPTEHRAAVQAALNETFAAQVSLRYEVAPDLVCGIEFATGGQKVAWSIAEYLGSLQSGVDELLQGQAATAAKADAAKAKPTAAKAKPAASKAKAKAKAKPSAAEAAPVAPGDAQ